jgi:glyceraldehyde 3-phosphate dehydrogenase
MNMAVKVAINGFGRIGRNILRAIVESGRKDIEVVAINDLGPVETNAHLLRYDSVHGKFPVQVTTGPDSIDVGRGPIRVLSTRNPEDLDWEGVDGVLQCAGRFNDRDQAAAQSGCPPRSQRRRPDLHWREIRHRRRGERDRARGLPGLQGHGDGP